MDLKEYEGRALFKQYGIAVPRGFLVRKISDPDDLAQAEKLAADFLHGAPDVREFVLKAQVSAGKRGKTGGIVFTKPEDFSSRLVELQGKKLHGETVHEVLTVEKLSIARELYLGIAVDRFERCPALIVSSEGGVDIEETAEAAPGKIYKVWIRSPDVFPENEVDDVLRNIVPEKILRKDFTNIASRLFQLFLKEDVMLAEINPLILTKEKKFLAADVKIVIDDNALYRHPGHLAFSRRGYSDLETKARESGLSYVELEGELAVIGNGAGLVMATLDAVKDFGARPANFCDIGGGATTGMMERAMEIVLQKKSVGALFINIFGGITHCDEIAGGLVNYVRKHRLKTPVVVRMIGTNEEQGRKILGEAGIESFSSFDEAARKAAVLAM